MTPLLYEDKYRRGIKANVRISCKYVASPWIIKIFDAICDLTGFLFLHADHIYSLKHNHFLFQL